MDIFMNMLPTLDGRIQTRPVRRRRARESHSCRYAAANCTDGTMYGADSSAATPTKQFRRRVFHQCTCILNQLLGKMLRFQRREVWLFLGRTGALAIEPLPVCGGGRIILALCSPKAAIYSARRFLQA